MQNTYCVHYMRKWKGASKIGAYVGICFKLSKARIHKLKIYK